MTLVFRHVVGEALNVIIQVLGQSCGTLTGCRGGVLPLLRAATYVDQGVLATLKPVIEAEEVQLFGYDY